MARQRKVRPWPEAGGAGAAELRRVAHRGSAADGRRWRAWLDGRSEQDAAEHLGLPLPALRMLAATLPGTVQRGEQVPLIGGEP